MIADKLTKRNRNMTDTISEEKLTGSRNVTDKQPQMQRITRCHICSPCVQVSLQGTHSVFDFSDLSVVVRLHLGYLLIVFREFLAHVSVIFWLFLGYMVAIFGISFGCFLDTKANRNVTEPQRNVTER